MESVVGHNLNDRDGLPDGIGVVVSQSLHLSGYLLNHRRRWYAFLINVQLHNTKTARGTTVAIADEAKVYILMPISTPTMLLTLMFHCCKRSFPRSLEEYCYVSRSPSLILVSNQIRRKYRTETV